MISVETLKEKVAPICERYRIRKAILFGSRARGEASRRSDIDAILIQDSALRFFDRYEGVFSALCRALPEWDVDLLIYTPEELAKIASRPFIAQALREGKVLYESN